MQDTPHYEIRSTELAGWIEEQGIDRWWSVDGDRLLSGRLPFPCPGDELAAEFRKLDRALLVYDFRTDPAGCGRVIRASELNALVCHQGDDGIGPTPESGPGNDRLLVLSWKDNPERWLLLEDDETTRSNQLDAAAAEGRA